MFFTSPTANIYGIQEIAGQNGYSLRGLFDAYSSWRRRRRQSVELNALSDATLKDIGVSRAEIEGIVRSPDRDKSGRVR